MAQVLNSSDCSSTISELEVSIICLRVDLQWQQSLTSGKTIIKWHIKNGLSNCRAGVWRYIEA